MALLATATSVGCAVCQCKNRAPASASAGSPSTASAKNSKAPDKVGYQWKNVTILGGGFVTGVIFSPAEKDLIYARTDIGGAYRFDPADKTWISLTDMFGRADSNYLGIESLAPDPVDAKKVYAAIGTYTQSWAGNGAMLRSSDRGATWQRTDMPFKMGGNENGRSNGERLAVDPRQTNILFFGSRKNGLWKSNDSGVTWNKVDGFPIGEEPTGVGITFVLFDPKSGAAGKPTPTIYAAVAKTDASLYRSTDEGATWKVVEKQPAKIMASHAGFDANGLLYVSYGNLPGPSDVVDGAVYSFDPKKGTWSNITPVAPGAADKFGYGGLSVDPSRAGTLMVTTIDRWTKGDEIFRTTDGGKSWKALAQRAVRDDGGAKYLYWGKEKPSSTGWMGDIDIDPFAPGHVMYVTGQGIWSSEDANLADADKPTHFTFLDRGLEETAVTGLLSPPWGASLLSVMGDICGFRHDDMTVAPPKGMFDNPIFSGGTDIDVAWSKPEIVVRVGSKGDAGKRAAYSIDGGVSWTPFAKEPEPGIGSGAIAVSADASTFFWIPKDGPGAFSRDRGATWSHAAGLPAPSKIPDWAPNNIRPAADRVNPKKLYAFDSLKGRAYASTDGGAHFMESSTGLPSLPDYDLGSGSIHAAPGVEGDVWITTGKALYHSTDSGKTYASLGNVEESNALGMGKAPTGNTYPVLYLIGKVGGVAGFFRSNDTGVSWSRINDDEHQFGFASVITGDARVYGRVYVGTGGRGIVYGDPK